MSGRAVPAEGARSHSAEEMAARWWLVLPLVLAVALIVIPKVAPDFTATWLDSERGLVEVSHVLIPLAAMVIALRCLLLPAMRSRPWLLAWVALAAVSCFYIAGEEASWGQHFLLWSTPETWGTLNDQNETNLHNVSSWFDQKPRTLLEIGVIVGGIILPIVGLFRPELRQWRFAVIVPPLLCLPTAVLAEVTRLSERVADMLGGEDPIFARASEVQELYFYLFVLFYLIILRRRIAALDDPRS